LGTAIQKLFGRNIFAAACVLCLFVEAFCCPSSEIDDEL